MCPSCPSHPKCTMVPQGIPWDSVRHTCVCMCPSCLSHPKCTMVPQGIPWDSVRHTCVCMCPSYLSYPKCTSKNLMGICKDLHMHVYMCSSCPSHPKCPVVPQRTPWDSACTCVQAVRPIPSVLWYLKESHGILYGTHACACVQAVRPIPKTSKNLMRFCKDLHMHVFKLSIQL